MHKRNAKPTCLIITGKPGSGKSTLAKKLGHILRLPVISRDEIKEGYVNTHGRSHAQLPAETNGAVSQLFFEIVRQYLAGSVSIIIEAAFQHHVWETALDSLVALADVRFAICTVDDATAMSRRRQRSKADPMRAFYHGDGGEDTAVSSRPYTPPDLDVPTIHVSTDHGYTPSLAKLLAQLQSVERLNFNI